MTNTMNEQFAGTGTMLGLALRRDRILLPLWILGLAAMAAGTAAATVALYPGEAQRIQASNAINSTAALVALYGRVYDPASLGALAMIKLTGYGPVIVGVLMAVITVRHTRGDEESGRLELLSGGRLGRLAPLAAALIVSATASALLGILTAVGLIASGLPLAGSIAFGLSWFCAGVIFAAVAAAAAQLASSARVALGVTLVVIALAFVLRAVGDLAEPAPSWLSWISPVGWSQQIRPFAGDRWWVTAIALIFTLFLVVVSFALRSGRDLGAGRVTQRAGPATGRLTSVHELAWRLQWKLLAVWLVAFAVFGLLLGSVSDSLTGFLTSGAATELIQQLGGRQVLIDAFISAEIGFLGVIAAAFGVNAALKLRSEESAGHVELLLGTATTRLRWSLSQVWVAVIGTSALLLVAGLALGTGAAMSLHDPSQLGRTVVATLAQIPAALIVTALVVILFGWIPRFTAVAWGLFSVFIVLGEFGVLWKAPQWLVDTSPFVHSPRLPVVADDLRVLVVLTLIAIVAGGLGVMGWRRRDLQP
jgi:ABC-2 type transport system permease protein